MSLNIKEDEMHHAEIFGKPVLFTNRLIPRDSVPDGWYCYDLRGSDYAPSKVTTLEDKVCVNHAGTILSPVPLKKPATVARRVNGTFSLQGELLDLMGFCKEYGLKYPQETRKYLLRPASSDEVGLFYSTNTPEMDKELACVGHLRIDFGRGGKEFWHTWWPHNDDELNIPAFKAELDQVMAELRERGPLKDLYTMSSYCSTYPQGILEDGCGSFGYIAESEGYRYCLRCTPRQGDYNGYLYVYDKRQQELNMTQQKQFGLTEAGKQALRDAADPAKFHTYQWFVIENVGMDDEDLTGNLTLEDAIQCFTGAECEIKVLGVTKDNISTVDLVASRYGELQHLPYYQSFDSTKEDPVILGAVEQLHQVLDTPEIAAGMEIGGM